MVQPNLLGGGKGLQRGRKASPPQERCEPTDLDTRKIGGVRPSTCLRRRSCGKLSVCALRSGLPDACRHPAKVIRILVARRRLVASERRKRNSDSPVERAPLEFRATRRKIRSSEDLRLPYEPHPSHTHLERQPASTPASSNEELLGAIGRNLLVVAPIG